MTQDDSDGQGGVTLTEEQHDWTTTFVGLDTRGNSNDDAGASTAHPAAGEIGGGDPPAGERWSSEPEESVETSGLAVGPSAPSGDPAVPNGQPIGSGGIPFYINPDVFDFGPDGPNWQKTSCVEVVFGYGSPFLPMTRVSVGVVVGAPLTLRDGKKLSVREAQLDSANAAEAAALIIKGMLDTGAIGPSEIQPRFVGFMGGAIMSTGLGYRVTGCHPK